jgi:hypothetical protein
MEYPSARIKNSQPSTEENTMIIIIHLVGGKTITFNDDFTQENINWLFERLSELKVIQHTDKGGKNYIIPTDKIIFIETKFNYEQKDEQKGVEKMQSQIKPVDPETTRSARIVEVIQTVSIRGNGFDNPVREVTQYWSKEGILLAEQDPCDGVD